MITKQFLYQSQTQLDRELADVTGDMACSIQLFTNGLLPQSAVALAKQVQKRCPKACVFGSSVSGVIYQGEQYENCTLVVVEQYEQVRPAAHMVSLENKSYCMVAQEMDQLLGEGKPALVRLFVGAYYDYAHQLIEKISALRPGLKVVGGCLGSYSPIPKRHPLYLTPAKPWRRGWFFVP